MKRGGRKGVAAYAALLFGAFAVALAASWALGTPIDNAAYDFMFRLYQPPPWQTQSVLLAIDEPTLNATTGGIRGIREPLAQALKIVAAAKPKAVAVDIILAEKSGNGRLDAELADALCSTPNLVLSSELIQDGSRWEDPRPEFKRCAKAVGHVHAKPDEGDSRTREIPLVRRNTGGRDQRLALSLEAFVLSRGEEITQFADSNDLQVGRTVIPVKGSPIVHRGQSNLQEQRLMRVRFIPPNMAPIPRISLSGLIADPSLASVFAGKVVFVGVTAQSEVRDRLLTPVSPANYTTGIVIHAEAFETMAQGRFLTDARNDWVFLVSLGLVAAVGLAFRYLPGWRAYASAVAVVLAAQVIPYVFFTHGVIFSLAVPLFSAVLAAMAAAAYYQLVVRRNWLVEQASRERYQQAMHFVTHEMRTPLSTIQGSSDLISRYALSEEKRKQVAVLINSESKRLARMVEIFLNVERLSAGQMELKREAIQAKEMVDVCVERVRPLGERKRIAMTLQPIPEDLTLTGDRELMEYACYNLLTNAVKYSPQRTEVTVACWKQGGHVRIAVKDQGIGMDQKEVKQIFQKFYRTKKAEQSGEMGSGIGLSIVQQIVEQHGGKIEVTSQPGVGSCFTLVLPAGMPGAVLPAAERN